LGSSIQSACQNAEGESPVIPYNTWVAIKGANLAPAGDSRTWQAADFNGTQMPVQLDKVSATVNGKSAYVYFISPAQINILTPPDAVSGPVQVTVTNNDALAAAADHDRGKICSGAVCGVGIAWGVSIQRRRAGRHFGWRSGRHRNVQRGGHSIRNMDRNTTLILRDRDAGFFQPASLHRKEE
jgi:hypothetical protein